MIVLFAFAYYLQVHSAYAQLVCSDQSDKSCCELGHCRSMWDIVWSCVTTIFTCTWVALHLNVPKQGQGRLRKFGHRAIAFGFALIAPEWIIMEAWIQRAHAKNIARNHKNDHWTVTHGFFVNMGGFMVQDENEMYVLQPDEIGIYLHEGQINMTKEDIQDKSKGDMLTKGFVVLQTTWFILQLFARAIAHLPITELEFSTLAFAILNGVTYGVWWNKPLDVQCPIILLQHTSAVNLGVVTADGSIAGHTMGGDYTNDGIQVYLNDQPEKHRQKHYCRRISSIPFLDTGVTNGRSSAGAYIFAGIGLLFGGIHCIGWVSHFPTTPEKLLWQISSIATVILPAMAAVCNFANDQATLSDLVRKTIIIVVLSLYPIARLFLLVLAFTTLRSLPPDAYTTVHWTTFVPHI